MTALEKLREEKGRLNWIIVDEAHHVMPALEQPVEQQISLRNTFFHNA